MNVNSNARSGFSRMSLVLLCAVAAVLGGSVRAQRPAVSATPADLYQQAMHQEQAVGNPDAAIELYRKVIAASPDRALAAQAQLRLAACYEKLARPTEAAAAYEAVVRSYADQASSVTVARAWLNRNGGTQDAQTGLRVERVWTGRLDMESRPFPDGRYVAFPDWTDGPAKLAVRDLTTGDTRILTREATSWQAFAENPLPSPDGKQIAFRFGEGPSAIRLVNADGTNMRVLLQDNHDHYLLAWSPDGRHIAATFDHPDRTVSFVLISTADGSTKQLKSIARPGAAHPNLGGFSPDGRFLVYAMSKGPKDAAGGVFLLATEGTAEVALLRAPEQGSTSFTDPAWTPDGRHVVFLSDRSGSPGLWSLAVKDGQAESGSLRLLQANANGMRPRGFSRDGSFFYLTQETLNEAYVAEFDPATRTATSPVPLTDQAVGHNSSPALSPDGRSVSFVRSRVGALSTVVVRAFATGEERTLGTIAGNAYGALTPQWYPDGRSLLVTEGIDNQRKRFRRVDVQSGNSTVVFDGSWGVWTGVLSADGKSLFYSLNEGRETPSDPNTLRLMKRSLDSGEEFELYRNRDGTGIGFFSLVASPDGKRLAFGVNRRSDDSRGLFIMPADGGQPVEIHRGGIAERESIREMNWTADSKTLVAVVNGQQRGDHLAIIPADGGEVKLLGVSMERIEKAMLAPDGRRLVFGGSTTKGEMWVIRNLLSGQERTQ
jgi:Tol biopolymer transport system component